MKKLLYLLPLLLLLFVGCSSKVEGDKELYQEVKEAYLVRLDEYKKNTGSDSLRKEVKLDKNNLDDYPLIIYNVENDYAVIFETDTKERVYFVMESDGKVTTDVSDVAINEAVSSLNPVYSQNDFKMGE